MDIDKVFYDGNNREYEKSLKQINDKWDKIEQEKFDSLDFSRGSPDKLREHKQKAKLEIEKEFESARLEDKKKAEDFYWGEYGGSRAAAFKTMMDYERSQSSDTYYNPEIEERGIEAEDSHER